MKKPSRYVLICLALIGLDIHAVKIHIFGDSHACYCFTNEYTGIPQNEISYYNPSNYALNFYIHWFSGKTMFSIGKNRLELLNLKKFCVEENDIVIFVFGEIDVRCHIAKQRDLHKRDLEEIIYTLANNFIQMINENRSNYASLTCFVTSIIPPTNSNDLAYPCFGSLNERANITKLLNSKLEELCKQNLIYFLDIYPLYATESGTLDLSLSDGIVHVNPHTNYRIKEMLIEQLKTKNLILE